MPKYRKKPVEIEARQWDGTVEGATAIIDWVLANGGTARFHDGHPAAIDIIVIDTLEGQMLALSDDWIIKGVKGEFYPCKPDIFEATYEAVTEVAPVVCLAERFRNSEPIFNGPHDPHFFEYGEDHEFVGHCGGRS